MPRLYNRHINPYAEKILSGKIPANIEQIQMMKNNVLPVLDRDDVYIDEQAIEDGLKLQKYFWYELIPWEKFLFALIAGLKFKEDDDIFFDTIRAIIGRGAGKNGFISFLIFYFISPVHGIRGYNVDLVANAEDQAKRSFEDVHAVVTDQADKELAQAIKANFRATKEEIVCTATQSKLTFNTSSTKGKDSKRTGCVVFDEKHEYVNDKNINTFRSGLGKMPHCREITITTDGHTRGGVLDKEKELNKKILEKYDPDNRTLVFWCRIEDKDKWNDFKELEKANPSIPYFKSLRKTIAKEIKEMSMTPDYFREFMAKRCNYPIGDNTVQVASWEDIVAASEQEMADIHGLDCVGGVDYSQTNDFTACVLLFKIGGKHYVLHHTFVCKQSRDLHGIQAPLDEWEKAGALEYVDNVEIPADMIVGWFIEQQRKYSLNIKMLGMDNFKYSFLMRELNAAGFDAKDKKNVLRVRPSNIMEKVQTINSLFINHNLVWADKIMNWYTYNTAKNFNGTTVYYGKIEPHYRKTDGFMAFVAAMCVSDELDEENTVIYDDVPAMTW